MLRWFNPRTRNRKRIFKLVMKISKNFTLKEAMYSQTATRRGIDNTPTEEHIANLKVIAEKIFQPLREHFGVPICVSSAYRSKKLNKAIGGSTTSQHCKGEALDLDADTYGQITNKQIFDYIAENLEYDQLIWEFGTEYPNGNPNWVHVSYSEGNNRMKKLTASRKEGYSTIYRYIK